jgi:hypothetical protein
LVWRGGIEKMGNMSYCRFENTVQDLEDCYDNFDLEEEASTYEVKARKKMINLCVDIAMDYGWEVDRPVDFV